MIVPNQYPKTMKRPLLISFLVLGACLICYLGLPTIWQIGFGMPGPTDFYLNRNKYQSIIQQAKSSAVMPGKSSRLILSGMTVWVDRDQSGFYTVTIETKDLGHAGEYGYIYSDGMLVTRSDVNYPQEKTLPTSGSLYFVDKRINAHWWSVYNNLG